MGYSLRKKGLDSGETCKKLEVVLPMVSKGEESQVQDEPTALPSSGGKFEQQTSRGDEETRKRKTVPIGHSKLDHPKKVKVNQHDPDTGHGR